MENLKAGLKHRLHLRELTFSLNNMIHKERAKYFFDLIASNKKNPKVLFDTISSIVSPAAPVAPVVSKADSNDFLSFFTNKVNDIRHGITPSSCGKPAHDKLPPQEWSHFNSVSLEDIKALIAKMKPSSSPFDVLPT